MKIGVLAVQGDFQKHLDVLSRIGVDSLAIRTGEQLDEIDGLIIPGGESTTIYKLLDRGNFFERARRFVTEKPVFGTCAGAIMLAKHLSNNTLRTLEAIDINIERNAYGRQVDSFIDDVGFLGQRIEAVFIRAPRILSVGEKTELLSELNGDPVIVRDNNVLACTFHPELTDNDSVHRYFVKMVKDFNG